MGRAVLHNDHARHQIHLHTVHGVLPEDRRAIDRGVGLWRQRLAQTVKDPLRLSGVFQRDHQIQVVEIRRQAAKVQEP